MLHPALRVLGLCNHSASGALLRAISPWLQGGQGPELHLRSKSIGPLVALPWPVAQASEARARVTHLGVCWADTSALSAIFPNVRVLTSTSIRSGRGSLLRCV